VTWRYTVELRPAARKQLDRVTAKYRARILRRLTALADDPRPPGVIALAGADDLWRVRVGDYRIIYTIDGDRLVVTVVRVAHRREVYRDL
jgi:mRNA interferase RelE/StbE